MKKVTRAITVFVSLILLFQVSLVSAHAEDISRHYEETDIINTSETDGLFDIIPVYNEAEGVTNPDLSIDSTDTDTIMTDQRGIIHFDISHLDEKIRPSETRKALILQDLL